jgi:hypothetical protein
MLGCCSSLGECFAFYSAQAFCHRPGQKCINGPPQFMEGENWPRLVAFHAGHRHSSARAIGAEMQRSASFRLLMSPQRRLCPAVIPGRDI